MTIPLRLPYTLCFLEVLVTGQWKVICRVQNILVVFLVVLPPEGSLPHPFRQVHHT